MYYFIIKHINQSSTGIYAIKEQQILLLLYYLHSVWLNIYFPQWQGLTTFYVFLGSSVCFSILISSCADCAYACVHVCMRECLHACSVHKLQFDDLPFLELEMIFDLKKKWRRSFNVMCMHLIQGM